jgi:hypothetical protein
LTRYGKASSSQVSAWHEGRRTLEKIAGLVNINSSSAAARPQIAMWPAQVNRA